LVCAVRVLFQDVAGDIVGPCLDIDRLLCPDGARTCDQENRDRNAGGELLRKHAFTSQTCWAACPGFEVTSFRGDYYCFENKGPSLTAAAEAVGRVSEAEPAIFPSAINGGLRCAPPALRAPWIYRHCRSRWRAMMTRMISLVPSRIWCTRTSRR